MRKGYRDITIPIKTTIHSLTDSNRLLTGKEYNQIENKIFAEMYNMLSTKAKDKLWAKYPKELELFQDVTENGFITKA